MTRAIYKSREDGDYDFVAAFDAEISTENDWVEQVQEWLENEGHDVLIVNNCDLNKLPDVWEGKQFGGRGMNYQTINVWGLYSKGRIPQFHLIEQEFTEHQENFVEIARRYINMVSSEKYSGIMLTIGDNFTEVYSRHQLRVFGSGLL